MYRRIFWAIAVLIGHTSASRGEYIVTFSQVGANVVATGSGSINTTALTDDGSVGTAAPRVTASNATVALGPTPTSVEEYVGFSGPTQFGTGGTFDATNSSGARVSIRGELSTIGLFLPVGYVSGTSLSTSTNTWNNTTIAGLGVRPGTYTWTWGTGSTSDSFVVMTVPEPASLVMLTLGLTAVAGLAWRHRKARLAA
jgi:hypothetical protein